MEGKTVKTDLAGRKMPFDDFVEAADDAVIEDAYRARPEDSIVRLGLTEE